ncbi:MAG: VOC family protein [Flavobacteriales bacterium]|nr:VOC family protein [Flavobacteriales bacterium]
MPLGAFSISLPVEDLGRSMDFYEKLGFSRFGGDGKHYAIMKNGRALIGLFQGMFKERILTFNPGWDEDANTLDRFTDVRDIRRHMEAQGIEVQQVAGGDSGPGSFVVIDPDGNPVLIDQHV